MKDDYCRIKGLFFYFFSIALFINPFSVNGAEPDYQVAVIEATSLENTLRKTGKVAYKRMLKLSFKSSGYLSTINIDEGEYFKQGDVLATLDITELNQQKNATYARLLQAKREVQRVESLLSKKLSSEKELDIAKTQVETLRADYKVAYYHLEKAQLIAPFDGVVLTRSSELGELQSPQKTVLTVAASSNNLIVKLALTSKEIAMVKMNQTVKVNLGAQGFVTGVISKMPAMADPQSHLFIIEVLIPDINYMKEMAVGNLVEVLITSTSEQLVYVLPVSALNKVNKQGKALIALKKAEEIYHKSFYIEKLTNDFIFLAASANDTAVNVITQGWQGLTIKPIAFAESN